MLLSLIQFSLFITFTKNDQSKVERKTETQNEIVKKDFSQLCLGSFLKHFLSRREALNEVSEGSF